jgi:hypothetical protein
MNILQHVRVFRCPSFFTAVLFCIEIPTPNALFSFSPAKIPTSFLNLNINTMGKYYLVCCISCFCIFDCFFPARAPDKHEFDGGDDGERNGWSLEWKLLVWSWNFEVLYIFKGG